MALLRQPHTSYSLVYPEGVPGDWAGWFINRHKGFPEIRKLQVKKHNAIGIQGRTWTPVFRRITNDWDEYWDTEPTQFQEVIDSALEMGLGDFTKVVFKINPRGHYLDYIYENFDEIHTKEANITNHIVLEFTDETMVEIVDTILKEGDRNITFEYNVTPYTFDNFYEGFVHFKDKFAEKGVNVDRIDLSKILKHDLHEYYRLCLLIDSPPLKNWKELVDDYTIILLEQHQG
mgnify:CR=1 FL=1